MLCCSAAPCCCCHPVHPGRVGSDGRCHLHIPHSHHHCPPLEPRTPLQTRSVLADRDTKWALNMCFQVTSADPGALACATCWDRMVTASLCLASRRLMLLTARMASPTCRPPHLSAGWLGWISEMRMGTPCSFPPWSEHTHTLKTWLGSSAWTLLL